MRAAAKEEQRQKPISRLSLAMLAAIVLLAIGAATPALASTSSASLSENSRHGVSAESGDLASASSRANSQTASDFEPGLRRNRVGFPPCPKGASARIGEFLDRHPRLNPRNYSVKTEGLGSNIGNVTVRYSGPERGIPARIYRGATQGNPNHVGLREGEKAVSFRDSMSNALPDLGEPPAPVLRPGRNYIEVDTSRLPPGSVVPDGDSIVDGVRLPHGHVSVTATAEEIVNATIGGGKFPK